MTAPSIPSASSTTSVPAASPEVSSGEPPLWSPSPARIAGSALTDFQQQLQQRFAVQFADYAALQRWSIDNPAEFWQAVWSFGEVRCSRTADAVYRPAARFFDAAWFDGARLNFAENLLRRRDDHPALIAYLETGARRELSYAQLYRQVAACAASLRRLGVVAGDRVAGMLPNIPEAMIAMLATASIGAVWSSCSPDFGASGVLDRFGQIEPKVFIACDGYYYGGKTLDVRAKLLEVAAGLPTVLQLVIVPLLPGTDNLAPLAAWPVLSFADFVADDATEIVFEQLPFAHPLYILYSSGTTGKPKCIVHGAGGTLLQHLKEHRLHTDIGAASVFFYFTTCGWMMWNWLASGLASGCTVVLFDGSPFHPTPTVLLDLIEREKISVFGTSARYLAALEKAAVSPHKTHRLDSLQTILSTGSPLSPESYRYVYREFKQDVCLSSISGGTDIVSCFIAGSPVLPVWEGELQCAGLGMAVDVVDENGVSIERGKGELICRQPFPSCPLGFWNDADRSRFNAAYFSRFPGVWAHGDFAEKTPHGGFIIHGRSDATLNPGGVRIGTAEIYRQVEKIPEVLEALCIGQRWQQDVRVVLFVSLRAGAVLDDALRESIRRVIRDNATPRHVPAKILAVADIPRTRSGKIVELAVANIVHGEPVANIEALANAEALEHFRNRPELDF
ncbi:MAG TPA: acetoacetate--CoA ligase [Spongiibacteraceae bacterium]|nr:acetoacetate--CoA ligase [Spongiibacteraceae bacterium]